MRNEAPCIVQLLAGLVDQTMPPAEIVLVDGGSNDGGPDLVRRTFGASVRLLEAGPAFPGAARNRGIAASRNDWIALIDAGCSPARDWLEQLVRGAARAGRTQALIAGRYDPVVRTDWDAAQALCLVAPPDAQGLRGPSTASLLLERRVWHALGGFREDLRAAEDLVFFREAASAGIPIVPAPAALVRWQLAPDLASCWRRLTSYSYHHARSGMAGTWHVRVMLMDTLLILVIGGAWYWTPALLIGVGLCMLRLLRTTVRRRENAPPGSVRLSTLARVAVLLTVADVAAWAGLLKALWRRSAG